MGLREIKLRGNLLELSSGVVLFGAVKLGKFAACVDRYATGFLSSHGVKGKVASLELFLLVLCVRDLVQTNISLINTPVPPGF